MESIQITEQVQQVQQEQQEQQVQQEPNDGFINIVKTKKGKYPVTQNLSFVNFQKLFSNKVITYYDKYGRETEFDNYGITKRTSEEVKDKNGNPLLNEKGDARTRHTVYMKTYISLMGDIVMITWDNDEVSFYTKLGHPELRNWGRKMYWKTE
jgi:hypothetical protein